MDFTRFISRTLGERIPISIGTALAVEALVAKPEVLGTRALWVNVRTLVRNYHSAITDKRERLEPTMVAEAIVEEVTAMLHALSAVGIDNEVVLYESTQAGLATELPYAILKRPTTTKQQEYETLEIRTIDALEDLEIRKFKTRLDGKQGKAVMLTHLPADLLSRSSFGELLLLESHTGELVPHTKWSRKLQCGELKGLLPFNIFTCQVYGDGSRTFKGYNIGTKSIVTALAIKHHWTPLTTMQKIKENIRTISDTGMAQLLLQLTLGTIK